MITNHKVTESAVRHLARRLNLRLVQRGDKYTIVQKAGTGGVNLCCREVTAQQAMEYLEHRAKVLRSQQNPPKRTVGAEYRPELQYA